MLLEPKERCTLVLLKSWRAFAVQTAHVYRLAELAGVVAIEKAIKISQPSAYHAGAKLTPRFIGEIPHQR